MQLYFPNINGLRFFAAAIVLLRHVEQFKQFLGQPSATFTYGPTGNDAVLFFFTLSGFLITYLLLTEKKTSGTISIKRFYFRRILRIWPLYYFVVIAGLLLLPAFSFFDVGQYTSMIELHFGRKVFLYLFLAANVAFVLYPYFPFISHTWSIAVEEQFYLVWPWVVKYVHHLLPVFVAVFVTFALLANGLAGWIIMFFQAQTGEPPSERLLAVTGYTDTFFSYFRIDCMAAGAVAAYIYHRYTIPAWLARSFRPLSQVIIPLSIGVIIVMGPLWEISDALYGPLFAWLILNFAVNRDCLFSLEKPTLNYLGKISYGIYMYHPFAIILIMKLMLLKMDIIEGVIANVFLYIASLLLTILLAAISYRWMESKFLRVSKKFRPANMNESAKDP